MIICEFCKSTNLINIMIFGDGKTGIISFTCNECKKSSGDAIKGNEN